MGRLHGALLLVTLVLVVVVAVPSPLEATQQPPDDNLLLTVIPSLRTAPAPSWVAPGVRLTYYAAGASVPGGRFRYVEDDRGNWVEEGSGRTFRQEEIPGSSSHGFIHADVLMVDRAVAAVDVRTYLIRGVSGPLVTAGLFSQVGLPGATGSWWIHPSGLREAAARRPAGLTILRMPYVVGGKRYAGMVFRYTWAQGYSGYVFDEGSGVLLHAGRSARGADIKGPLALGDRREGHLMLSQANLVGVRTLQIPWASSPLPGWVGQVAALRYEGRQTATGPTGAFSVPVAVVYERQGVGASWARYTQTFIQGTSPPATTRIERVFGSAQLNGLWVAPQFLGRLRSGQALDRDPVTKVVVAVTRIGSLPQGIQGVTITEDSPGERVDYTYDMQSGVLVAYRNLDKVLNFETEVRLAGRQ